MADPVKFLCRYVTMDETELAISTQKWTDKVCSGRTQPYIQWSCFKRPHRPQSYGVCILGLRRNSDEWLFVARQDCPRCILRWTSPQMRKVIKEKHHTASQWQCTSAHLPCCHGRCAWVWLRTPLSTTFFCIKFPTVQIFKEITQWSCFWERRSCHYGHKRADWRARSKFLLWRYKSIAAKME